VRFRFIEAEKAQHPVALLCHCLQVSRQGFYAWSRRRPSLRRTEDQKLVKHIRRIHEAARRSYGAPRVVVRLRQDGVRISRKRVARLMRLDGLAAKRRRRFVRTTDSKHGLRVAPNVLARAFRPAAPDRAWAADITYVPTRAGWLFLAVVLDLFSRKVVGWAIEPFLDRRLALKALRMALESRQPAPGLIHHSDRGVQYACDAYRAALREAGAVASMSKAGNCWDNAVAESFFATLKTELVHRHDFGSRSDARAALFEYIEVFYNRQRLHSTLGYRTPVQYESARLVSET
jgi:putative transposase